MVRARSHHTRAEIVEVDGKHQILMAMRKGLEIALRRHFGRERRERATSFNKVRFEMLTHVRFHGGRFPVGAGLLDQRRDEIGLLKDILERDDIQMGPAMEGGAPCVVCDLTVRGERRIAGGGRGQTRRRQVVQEGWTSEQTCHGLQVALNGVLCMLSLVVVARIHGAAVRVRARCR